MRPSDLLSLAASAARAAPTVRSPKGDGDAFARALDSELRTTNTSDGHCGVTPTPADTASDTETDAAAADTPRVPLGDRPVRDRPGFLSHQNTEAAAARSDWRDFVQSLRDMGLLSARPVAGAEPAKAAGAETAKTDGTSAPKPGPQDIFSTALDALGQAIQAALADPSANAAQPGQLPPAVQTALDAAVAAAPAPLQGRIQAFGQRLTQRLAAAMAGETGPAGETPPAGSKQASANTGTVGSAAAQALLAALNGPGDGSALAMLKDLKAKGSLSDQLIAEPRTARTATDAKAAPAAGAVARVLDADPAPKANVAAPAAQANTIDPASQRTAQAAAELPAEVSAPATGQSAAATEAAQAPAATPAPTAPAHIATLAAARGAPEIVAQLAATISRKLDGRVTRFTMELNPAEMGRVDVKLSIEADGRLAAQMSFDNPAAAADMRGKADDLRRQLEQAGFNVKNEDLTFSDRETSQGFGQGSGQPQRGRQDSDAARGRAFVEADRTARLAEDAGRLSNRAVLGLDMKV